MEKISLFEKFILQNLDSAYGFAYTYMHNRQDAEDVVQESVEKALNGLAGLREPQYMKTWFYRIIANTAVSQLRRRGRIFVEHDSEEIMAQIGTEDDYSRINLEQLCSSLVPKYREVVVLRFLENLSLKEIAQVLELNENTVKSRLYRGLEILRMEMEDVR